MENRLFPFNSARPAGRPSPIPPVARREPARGLLLWLRHSAAALGLERVDGRWTLPAVASYFEDPPDKGQCP